MRKNKNIMIDNNTTENSTLYKKIRNKLFKSKEITRIKYYPSLFQLLIHPGKTIMNQKPTTKEKYFTAVYTLKELELFDGVELQLLVTQLEEYLSKELLELRAKNVRIEMSNMTVMSMPRSIDEQEAYQVVDSIDLNRYYQESNYKFRCELPTDESIRNIYYTINDLESILSRSASDIASSKVKFTRQQYQFEEWI